MGNQVEICRLAASRPSSDGARNIADGAGIWAWAPNSSSEIDEASLARVIAARDEIDILLIGTGREHGPLPEALQLRLRELGIRFDVMTTSAAASTYNILLAEGRRAAVALLPG